MYEAGVQALVQLGDIWGGVGWLMVLGSGY